MAVGVESVGVGWVWRVWRADKKGLVVSVGSVSVVGCAVAVTRLGWRWA